MDELSELFKKSDSTYEEIIRNNLDERVIVINNDISTDILEDAILYIFQWNKEDLDKPKDKRKPIKLYINSNGGDVIAGFSLVGAIAASETPIWGICFGMCASMAFHILIACHMRYCFPDSILLLHDGEIGVHNSSSKVKDTMEFFDTLALRTKKHVLKYTKITEEFYDDNYERELYFFGNDEGKIYGCIDFVIGEDCTLSDIL